MRTNLQDGTNTTRKHFVAWTQHGEEHKMPFVKGNTEWEKSRRGRKSGLETLDWKLLERLAFANLTDRQLGVALGVSERTINNWKEGARFHAVIKKGREARGAFVEASLCQRAIGYTYDEETWERKQLDGELRLTKRVRKHVAPSDLACFFLLTNWKPDEYKHKGAIEGGEVPNIIINGLPTTLPELQALRERINRVRARKRQAAGTLPEHTSESGGGSGGQG